MKKKQFEKQLPEGYTLAYTFDATDKKLGIKMILVVLLVMVLFGIGGYFLFKPPFDFFLPPTEAPLCCGWCYSSYLW